MEVGDKNTWFTECLHLFNNLELKDIRLKESTGNIPRMGYISFPSILQPKAVRNEYISYEFLSKLYKSIDTKND